MIGDANSTTVTSCNIMIRRSKRGDEYERIGIRDIPVK